MKPLTYRQLLVALYELTDEQLDMSVSVFDNYDEIQPIYDTVLVSELRRRRRGVEDVVEENQPLLVTFDDS